MTPPDKPPVLARDVSIDAADIDHMGHVNNAVYLTWVQDIVVAHWQRFAPADAIASHLWVALKHEITYRRPTFLTDTVTAQTAVEAIAGAKAFYRTLITRGGEVLAEVSSTWCALNSTTGRPIRIAQSLRDIFQPRPEAG